MEVDKPSNRRGTRARVASPAAKDFARRLIAWQPAHGRHDLPWQGTRDPYRIWLSEIMLQQTQVAAVVPYFQRFLERFPDIESLAAADEDAVLILWSGLGYYARARNLHRAAQAIMHTHAGAFPRERDAIEALPGVGRSTASAICVFAYGARHTILDGNVKRLLARYFGVEGYPGEKGVEAQLWSHSERLLPAQHIEAYTQGLMDLGATICTRRAPSCGDCPVRERCVALRENRVHALPTPRPRKTLPERVTTMLVLAGQGEVLLEKRPATGIWGGLWCFPQTDETFWPSAVGRYGVELEALQRLEEVEHSFTHFRLKITPMLFQVKRQNRVEEPGRVWLPRADALGAAIPAPVKRILLALSKEI